MKNVKLFLSDVDGCMTDGGMYYDAEGNELKRFCVYDGMGMVQLRKQGIPCGILTSETTRIVERRARKLNLEYLYMGVGRQVDATPVLRYAPAIAEPVHLPFRTKLAAAEELCQELGITLAEVCYVGDDVNDLDILSKVGFPVCPSNAVAQVKAIPNILVLQHKGGDGAIREICEKILDSFRG